MARPKQNQPTPGELEVLKILWEIGPATVRSVMEKLNEELSRKKEEPRAYTTVMSLLNVMADKRLLKRTPQGRAFLYEPNAARDKTLGNLVEDLLGRAFEGSAQALVARLLDQSNPSAEELAAIRETIDAWQQNVEGDEP